jgi:hypothetical protein
MVAKYNLVHLSPLRYKLLDQLYLTMQGGPHILAQLSGFLTISSDLALSHTASPTASADVIERQFFES